MALIRRANSMEAARTARDNAHMFDGRTTTANVRPLIPQPPTSAVALPSSLSRMGGDTKILAAPVVVTTGHELKRLPPMIEGRKEDVASPINNDDDGSHHTSSSPSCRVLNTLRQRHLNYR
eukprot:CAMPEP_0185252532 /NCGR_PEP_ID=MMETSP1359-20130426/1592_1 /TAXON_ID=552665 /ORGANISM="Bigelowiella longifila, Strain CCMP242" /LENGTH=120 /DNA_ID=CAMNT_0027834721 /DNA_START=613 /DNA_END=975 /DNA_ORIENTATION=-